MSEIEALKAEVERCRRVAQEAEQALEQAEQDLLRERFKDWDQYKEGDIVLVPRKLFGKRVMWPAKVTQVYLRYSEGWYQDDGRHEWSGEHWENQHISYQVFYLDKDTMTVKPGTTSAGVAHDQVRPYQETANA